MGARRRHLHEHRFRKPPGTPAGPPPSCTPTPVTRGGISSDNIPMPEPGAVIGAGIEQAFAVMACRPAHPQRDNPPQAHTHVGGF